MIPPIEIMKQAYGQQDPPFTGSISELIVQEELAAAQDQMQEQEALDIAATPQEQQVGLTQGPPRPMGFPIEPGPTNDFNTVGMPGPIIKTDFKDGVAIDSSKILEPGLVGIKTHPKADFVLEEPMYAKTGGTFKNPTKDFSFAEKIERYKKLRNEKR